MKNQLTELLTNYGEIMCIWFDGHWDQTNPEGHNDRSSRIDWKYDEIYGLIHQLQPQCMIGNNHHLSPFPGEDFQMFERDLPGENKSGLSFQKASDQVPLESCETTNGSWGYNITDRHYKTPAEVIRLLVGAAGRNSNLLLNIGPMPSGAVQPEFTDTLADAGKWLQQNGESIYGTRGGPLAPQTWGVTTQKEKKIFLHLFQNPDHNSIFLPGIKEKVKQVSLLNAEQKLSFRQVPEGIIVSTNDVIIKEPDTVVVVDLK
jgi:alpha-L-fucosidase